MAVEWTRRSHGGWAWLDEVGVPGDPFAELYRVNIEGPAGQRILETQTPGLECPLGDLPADAGQTVRLTVVTVGPKAVSHGVSAILTL